MTHKIIVLSKAEKLLTEWAHSDHAAAYKHADEIMQARLNSIAESHSVPDGTQLQFLKHPDGSMTLEYDVPEADEGEVVGKIGSDGEVYDENGEDGG